MTRKPALATPMIVLCLCMAVLSTIHTFASNAGRGLLYFRGTKAGRSGIWVLDPRTWKATLVYADRESTHGPVTIRALFWSPHLESIIGVKHEENTKTWEVVCLDERGKLQPVLRSASPIHRALTTSRSQLLLFMQTQQGRIGLFSTSADSEAPIEFTVRGCDSNSLWAPNLQPISKTMPLFICCNGKAAFLASLQGSALTLTSLWPAKAVSASPYANSVAVLTEEGNVELVDTETLKKRVRVLTRQRLAKSIQLAADGSSVAVTALEPGKFPPVTTVEVWRVGVPYAKKKMTGFSLILPDTAWSP